MVTTPLGTALDHPIDDARSRVRPVGCETVSARMIHSIVGSGVADRNSSIGSPDARSRSLIGPEHLINHAVLLALMHASYMCRAPGLPPRSFCEMSDLS